MSTGPNGSGKDLTLTMDIQKQKIPLISGTPFGETKLSISKKQTLKISMIEFKIKGK